MYRYSVDNAITYTSEDFVLFRESPFASWMERLTLENPDHGIEPDPGSEAPRDALESQADLAEVLRAEGKQVRLIDPGAAEPVRRAATLEAMRLGVDFIVDGQLALGPLSGTVNLLMRSSGFSDLGNYLYLPCDTQGRSTQHSAFRLCFLADLLHSLQGQLPPQLLVIRGGQDVAPLVTDDHIYPYRAVKKRFMDAQRNFRKHRMPDPAESSHFGRWAVCANEVIKQRLLTQSSDEVVEEAPQPATLGDALEASVSAPDAGAQRKSGSMPAAGTLAEQARQLKEEPQKAALAAAAVGQEALENLAFIGSSQGTPIGQQAVAAPPDALGSVHAAAAATQPQQIPGGSLGTGGRPIEGHPTEGRPAGDRPRRPFSDSLMTSDANPADD